ncbi:MAG: PDZ domain-containing protein [Gemmatimonadetes bacterium]|nr:PDZ domain-containing protein [Gemmatimonadota bacterium]
MDKAHERRFELLGTAVLLTAWGLAGFLFNPSGYTDALYEPDYTIQNVPEGGVLAEAGFQQGDTVVAVEGIPVEELGMYSRWPRALSRRPGESLQITVKRGGVRVEGSLVAQEPPTSIRTGRLVVLLFTQAFLWLGIWTLFTTPTAHAGRLALLGLVAGLATPGPNLGSLNGLRDHLEVAGEVLLLILLLHFLLLFPRAKQPARSRWIGLIYLPWVGLLVAQVAELVTHPRMYHALGGYLGILFLGYLLASGVTVVHTAAMLPREEHASSGMGPVLIGWAVAAFPNLLVVAGWTIPPGWDTPGQQYFPFLVLAVPVGMALGVRRQGRSVSAGTQQGLATAG